MRDPIYPALQLTDACNKQCRVCLRVPGEQSHHLDRDTFFHYLEDIDRVSSVYPLGFQFVTGGEPTIWKDNGMDVVDVLSALSKKEKIKSITLPTNGKLLEKKNYAEAFLERISCSVSQTIIIGLSIAEYQENLIDGKSKALDNLIAQMTKPGNKTFPVTLVTLSREDDTDKILKQNYPDVIQRVTPLAPLGAGKNELDECPALSLAGSDKTDLGSFFPYFMKDVTSRLNINEDDFAATPNREIMNRLSLFAHCGRSPFIDKTWHYCLPFRENPAFDLAEVGGMKENTIDEFLDRKPLLQRIRQMGVLDAVETYRDRLSRGTRKKLDHLFSPDHKVSVAYRGCMICKELASLGIWEEVIELSTK